MHRSRSNTWVIRKFFVKSFYFASCCFLLFFTLGSSPAQVIPTESKVSNALLYSSKLPDQIEPFAQTNVFQITFYSPRHEFSPTTQSRSLINKPEIPSYSPLDWYALNNKGLFGSDISAIVVVGDDLYVGGKFTATHDGSWTNLGNIVRYDTKSGTWHKMPNQGLNGDVFALAVFGDYLYVGGNFTASGDGLVTNLGNITRYHLKSHQWHKMPNQGLDNRVFAFAVHGDNLYVGGNFQSTVDNAWTKLGCIARYNTKNGTWNELSRQGLFGSDDTWVLALQVSGTDLYVGGEFNETGDHNIKNLNNITRYDTKNNTWHPLAHKGLKGEVLAMALSGGTIYLAGYMTGTYDDLVNDLNNITRYEISSDTWHALPHQGMDGIAYSLAMAGSDLYVGGGFSKTYDMLIGDLNSITRYDTKADKWYPIINLGLNQHVTVLTTSGNDLFVGGSFSETYDKSVGDLNLIARLELSVPQNGYLPLVIKR